MLVPPFDSSGPRVEANFVGNIRNHGYASGIMGAAAQSFPSLNEDSEYTPGPEGGRPRGRRRGHSGLYTRYNIEEYATSRGKTATQALKVTMVVTVWLILAAEPGRATLGQVELAGGEEADIEEDWSCSTST